MTSCCSTVINLEDKVTTLSSTVTLRGQIGQGNSLDRLGEFATLQWSFFVKYAIAVMALWLLCCVLLFITSRGYDWLSHQNWFLVPELSLPWIVLGGLGLAIASNDEARRWLKMAAQFDSPATHSLPKAVSQGTFDPTAASVNSPPPPAEAILIRRSSPASPRATQETSISFKIVDGKAPSDV